MTSLTLNANGTTIDVHVRNLVIAGFTGRDAAAVRRHINELERAGVPAPGSVPAFYVVPPELITTGREIEVDGDETSGEAEPVLVITPQGTFVGIGSDHTDRRRERDDIAAAKAACPKVIGDTLVPLDDVAPIWDELVLESWVDGGTPYQHARAGELLPVEKIIEQLEAGVGAAAPGTVLFCGTVPLRRGGFSFSDTFRCQLTRPDGEALSTCSYRVRRR